MDIDTQATLKIGKHGLSISDVQYYIDIEVSKVEISDNEDYYKYDSEQKVNENNEISLDY